jgi:PST family polysaccharide transporter
MFWAYGSYVGGRLLSLVATAILARLILPKDFGLVALGLVAMAFLDTFPGLGVGEALVVADEDEIEEKAETAFVVQVAVGLVLTAAAAAPGPVGA